MTPTKIASPRLGAQPVTVPKQIGHFVLHFVEMCAPMCIGFAVGDLLYFWLAGLAGYSEPFSELPYLSVIVVTVSMTVPMTAWMLYRGMPHRAVAEMSAAMPVRRSTAPSCPLMPAMLVPMFLRLDLYTGRTGHAAHTRRATSQP